MGFNLGRCCIVGKALLVSTAPLFKLGQCTFSWKESTVGSFLIINCLVATYMISSECVVVAYRSTATTAIRTSVPLALIANPLICAEPPEQCCKRNGVIRRNVSWEIELNIHYRIHGDGGLFTRRASNCGCQGSCERLVYTSAWTAPRE